MKAEAGGAGSGAGLVLAWALIWAIPGFGIELLANLGVPIGAGIDMWPQTLAIPGLIAGVIFCGLLAVSGRWRTFAASSRGVLAGLGLVVGLVMSGVLATGVVGGEDSPGSYVFVVVMSVVAAVASALLFGFLARRNAAARTEA